MLRYNEGDLVLTDNLQVSSAARNPSYIESMPQCHLAVAYAAPRLVDSMF